MALRIILNISSVFCFLTYRFVHMEVRYWIYNPTEYKQRMTHTPYGNQECMQILLMAGEASLVLS